MHKPPPAPPSPPAKRTIVGTGPRPNPAVPVAKDTARMVKPRPDFGRDQQAPTLAAMPGSAPSLTTERPTGPDPTAQPAAEGRTTGEDFQQSRHKHTHMAGTGGLSEPGADQPRIRLIPGKVVPGTRYRILRWLGEGGMGVVYEAEHVDIERRVALKILRFDLSQEPNMAQVFRDEARAASRVGSKHIVEIYDFGELSDGRLFFCMELIPGGDLVFASEDDWVEPARLIGLLRQICKGLAVAHDAGIVHRDIKPENIILVTQEGRELVKIVDFGISAMLAAGQDQGNTIAGTPHYMAPEQITGTKFDGRLDVYALGCMAYELLVGHPPFVADAIQELLRQQLYDEPKPLRECRPEREIPQELADVIMRCLAKDPEQRWADMRDLEAALCEAQIAAGLTTPWDDLPLPDVEPERRARLVAGMPNPHEIVIERGNRWLMPLVAAALALVLGVGVTWALLGGKPSEEELAQIDALTTEARTAASRTQWVYPPNTDPSAPTAFQKIVALEALEGSADAAGRERAEELREEFSATLKHLGDRHWDNPATRGFAGEFYAMALLFNPDDRDARERSGLTPALLADFQARAALGEFTAAELEAALWIDVLAEDDKEVAAKKADELLLALSHDEASPSSGALLLRSRAVDAARGAGIAVAAPKPTSASTLGDELGSGSDSAGSGSGSNSAGGSGSDAGTAGDELNDDDGDDGDELDDPKSGRTKSGKSKSKSGEAGLGSNTRDPNKAAELAKQGEAALKAGRRSEATTLFNQAISYDHRNAMALMGLSEVYFDTGSNQKAVLYAEKAVEAAPKNSNYRIQLGDAYFKVLRYRDALEQYQKAKDLGSSRADARINKAKDKIGK